jgi:uncharacterized protein YqgV (UPF0045/DUF77 family)
MQLSIEISLYPLQDDYIPVIKSFIDAANNYTDVTVITSTMSTRLIGEYDIVMKLLNEQIKISFEKFGKQVFVCKFINGALHPTEEYV